ncbi:hypothetical protein BDV3_005611 [Batrachochytrium dendrobatidis]
MSVNKKQSTLGRFFGTSASVSAHPKLPLFPKETDSSSNIESNTLKKSPTKFKTKILDTLEKSTAKPSFLNDQECESTNSPIDTLEPNSDLDSLAPTKKSKRKVIQSDSDVTSDDAKTKSPNYSSSSKKDKSLQKSKNIKPSKVPKSDNALNQSSDESTTPSSVKRSCKLSPKTKPNKKVLPSSPVKETDQTGLSSNSESFLENKTDITEPKKSIIKKKKDVLYSALCDAFLSIEATTKRLEIQSILSNFFREVIVASPDQLIECVYLCINRICPEYEGKELGIGESLLIKALANASGRDAKSIKAEIDQVGDLGSVAQSKGYQKTLFKPKPLTVTSVFKTLKEICNISGQSSQQRKINIIQKMLVSCQGSEAKYLIRSLEGKLRIGLAEQTVLTSLAHASALNESTTIKMSTEKKAALLADATVMIKSVYSAIPSYDAIIPVLLKYGFKELSTHCHMTPGIPMKPMLAHPTKSLSEVLDRFDGMAFTCEYKYDGERAQIHRLEDGQVIIYSRNSENLSGKYPEVLERIPKASKENIKSFVLDCEAVAWDVQKECILPFQVLSTRKRKDVKSDDVQVQVCIFAFDLLYLNGQSMITETLKRRRELLHENFVEVDGQFQFAKHMTSNSVDEIQIFLDDSIVGNCEGLMVKTLEKEASYEPSKRSRNWLKVKKDYVNGLGDSLDLVVIGGFIGRGKRTGWYGGYLLACFDPDREEYQTICKIGTGFSEEALAEQAESFKSHIISKPKPYYRFGDGPNVRPDVWFEPTQVWEIKAADLSISPVHQAAVGLVDPQKGISLRFPRFIRVRDDKSPEQATSASQIAEMYNAQNINTNEANDKNDDFMDDDF